MPGTLDYYNQNAKEFVQGTRFADFTRTQDRFLDQLNDGDYILDFGCGSGRDAKYFLDKGYRVDATDGSAELCRLASEFAGVAVKQMLFTELDEIDKYDGIWACSSILHCPKNELKGVLLKMARALKNGGIVYTSFKYGDFEGTREGRYYSDFTREGFAQFISDIVEFTIEECWISGDVRPGRDEEKWLNLLLRKNGKGLTEDEL